MLSGFGLQVTERGARSYVVQYRIGRKSRRIAIKDVLKFKDAKKEARKLLGEAATGGDPLARRRKEPAIASNTLKAVAQEYFKRERARVRTMDDREATFERLIFPRLEAANARPRFTISLKRSTQNLQLSTSSPADYPI
jgi:hypothetical protein